MARIRTIKPEFFTSEDIVSLSPMARLLYIASWCEADKEGRLAWKPMTFKMRYFPGDDCNINALCQEVVNAGLVVLYADGLAYIPSFLIHQHINPREKASILPTPDASARVINASARVSDETPECVSTRREEGKGREGKDSTRDAIPATPSGFADFWETWPSSDRKQAKGKCMEVWKKAHAERDAEAVLAHVSRLKESNSWTKNNGEYIPAPLVYLNKRSWEGADLEDEKSPAARMMAGAI